MSETKRKREAPEIMKRTGRMLLLDVERDKVFEVADPGLFRKFLSKDSGRYIEA